MRLTRFTLVIILSSLISFAAKGENIAIVAKHIQHNTQASNQGLSAPVRFSLQDSVTTYRETAPIAISGGRIVLVWAAVNVINAAVSSDTGYTWGSQRVAAIANSFVDLLCGVRTNSGRIIIAWYDSTGLRSCSSDNDGITWSVITTLSPFRTTRSLALSKTSDGKLWLSYRGIFGSRFITSTDNGTTWSTDQTAHRDFNHYVDGIGGNLHSIYLFPSTTIEIRTTTDGGSTWSSPRSVVSASETVDRPRVLRLLNGTLWVIYQLRKPNAHQGYFHNDLMITRSSDEGLTWSAPATFTRFVGEDSSPSVTLWNDMPFVSFISSRGQLNFNRRIWLGLVGVTRDSTPPPVFLYGTHSNERTELYDTTRAYLDDESGVAAASVSRYINGAPSGTFTMYDDGLHGDILAGDNVWGGILTPPNQPGDAQYSYRITDNAGNVIEGRGVSFTIRAADLGHEFNINRVILPINFAGVLGDVFINGSSGGRFDGRSFLFSGGFFLSGKIGGTMWANAVASASRIQDYLGGKIGFPDSVGVFLLDRNDPPFGSSWQKWRSAVFGGAAFYDGNNDGVYNPVDLNGNGRWDANEDAPDLLGDATAWCVYNDGVPSSQRRFTEITPKGIEIQQTVFGWRTSIAPLGNMLFIRYRISNGGTLAAAMDSVYFGSWQDGDLGDYNDDLVGSDTSRNSGYIWNDGDDPLFGANPPAFFSTMVQGPHAYIPGVTFVDANGNGTYDPGEVALDTANVMNGARLGVRRFPGAKILPPSSYVNYVQSNPERGDPNTAVEARNYSLGKLRTGSELNPCSDPFGSVFGIPCANVSKRFWYSGNSSSSPGFGWIYTTPGDVRSMLNVGPFKLEQNKPVDIIVAYLLGRGTDARNSVAVARTIADRAILEHRNNFSTVTSVGGGKEFPQTFELHQNYPNPFNPSTTIGYQLPTMSRVTLKVFDVLGREVATLVDEVQDVGFKQVEFNASHFASGVYFYQLQAGNFSATRKLLLMK